MGEVTNDARGQALDIATAMLTRATAVLVVTGAGISTDSGIPDFRGPQGVWTKDPGAEMLSTYDAYVGDADVRRRAWVSRLTSPYWHAEPNDGHRAVLAIDRSGRLDTLVTQNIDRLHHASGVDPAKIVEIHGNGHEVVCLTCADRQPMRTALDRVRAGEQDPRCLALVQGSVCGGILKSATISFGQSLREVDLERAHEAARRCDLVLAIGSTLSVYPAAGVVPMAHQRGVGVIIVNGEPTALDALADVLVSGDITSALTAMVAGL